MRRAVFLLLVAVSCLGCNATGPGFGRWATGPQLIPPPPTGSFGQPATTPPYYQSRSPTAGRQAPRTPLLTTSQTPELSPGTVTSAGLETTAEAGSSGWRSPGEIIQRATAEESQGDTSARHDSPLRHQINAATFPIRSVLVDEPGEVIVPRLARQSSPLAIQPMVASGTVIETSEPRRLDVPDQLTEITNLPLVGQSVAPASREVQELTLPATTSGNGFTNSLKPGQWRQSGVDVR